MKRLLLDTHIVIAVIDDRIGELPPRISALLQDDRNLQFVSAASLWEIAIKHRLGKLHFQVPLQSFPAVLVLSRIELLPI